MPICNIKNILLSIPDTEKISIPQMEKIIFIYIAYGYFSIHDVEKKA